MAEHPTLNITQNLTRAGSVVRTLEKMGAPITDEITKAVKFAQETNYDPSGQVRTAQDTLRGAKTPAEVAKALDGLSVALGAHQVSSGVANVLEAEKWRRVSGALMGNQEAIFNHLAVGFDSLAGKFQKAAVKLPANLGDKNTSVFSPSRAESEAIQDTVDLAKQMNPIYSAYGQLCQIGQYLDDDRLIPYALGELTRDSQAISAHTAITAAKVSDSGKTLRPIMPYIVIHQLGVKLRLHPRPWELQEERQRLIDEFGTSIGAVGTTVLGSF